MAELNSNHDSVINNSDINFSSLKVWTDINSNGVTNDSELHTLADLGTVSFDFNATATSTRDHGNTVGLVSSYLVGVVKDSPTAWPTSVFRPMQGVASMVDAMTTLKNGGAGAGNASDTAQQMLWALRKFEAIGNLVARQATTVADLAGT